MIHQVTYPDFYGTGMLDPEAQEEALVARSSTELRELTRGLKGKEVETTHKVRAGDPAGEILAFVEDEKVDMIVMGTHGLTGLNRILSGSVTEKVVRHADRPIFTVKSFGRSLLTTNTNEPLSRQVDPV